MSYKEAKEAYARIGIDTEQALKTLKTIPISIQCWQGDDVSGFENKLGATGGIQTTGNYPGKATTPAELMSDYKFALDLIPGTKRINLHAIYGISNEEMDRQFVKKEYFDKWLEFAKENDVKIDFNPTFFSHKLASEGMTLSHPDKKIREYWINHGKTSRETAAYIGKVQNSPCLCNLWIPDGLKDTPASRLNPRMRLKESLDEIYSVKYPKEYLIDSVESKLFGIGLESYTVGNNEFYQLYAAKNDLCCLLDTGHFHPTEKVSDKISSLLCFNDKVALHVSRPVRWDSDHVIILNDELVEIAKEIVRNNATDRVIIGLDYFDASINRIAAWVIGTRNMQKALLYALLQPNEALIKMQDDRNFTDLLAYSEEYKTMPWGEVWTEYLRRENKPQDFMPEVKKYEKEVLLKR